jgi:hypothetical protein
MIQTWENGTKQMTNIEGMRLQYLIQPQPVTKGSNSLGLQPGATDVVMSTITAGYTNMSDDDLVQNIIQGIVDQHIDLLRRAGLYIPYQYLNYADSSQDPIGSYGPESKARLQAVSKRYDPDALFQRAVPGGFKLFE